MALLSLEQFEAFNKIFTTVGMPPLTMRTIIVDYRDKENNYYNHTHQMLCPPDKHISNEFIIEQTLNHYEPDGYIVYSIIELLQGFTEKDLQTMRMASSKAAREYIRPIYFDKSKEQSN